MATFYTLLTDIGQNKLANAVALGQTIQITDLAVGDGGGSLPTPDSSATALVNEVRRAPINTSTTDPDNPSWIIVEQVLPPDVGGWTVREIGIFDIDGDLLGVGNYPETYKPVLSEGSSRTQTVRFVLEVSDTAAVTLKVDPSVVLATREYVDTQRAEHEASRNHPAATEAAQGMARIATQAETDAGTDDGKFITAKKLKNWVKQATESVMGLLKVATQSQVDAGDDDTTAVTPKKLRWGFVYSIGSNGYLVFPSWMAGFVIQWGNQLTPSGTTTYAFPIAFPNGAYLWVASHGSISSGTDPIVIGMGVDSTTNYRLKQISNGSATARWIAVGR